jgi:hypothetical protein
MQNVASSEKTIRKQNVDPLQPGFKEQNVVPSKLRTDESSNLCGLKLTIVRVYNSNDDITPNANWEFRSKNGGLDCLKIYIH